MIRPALRGKGPLGHFKIAHFMLQNGGGFLMEASLSSLALRANKEIQLVTLLINSVRRAPEKRIR